MRLPFLRSIAPYIALFAFVLVAGASSPAQSPAPASSTIADTPARRALDVAIRMLDTEHAPPPPDDQFLLSESLEATLPRDAALRRLQELALRSQGLETLETRQLEPGLAGAWLRARNNKRSLWILKIGVEPEQPHRINRLELTPAPPPGVSADVLWQRVEDAVKASGFEVSILACEIMPDTSLRPIRAFNPDQTLAIGMMGGIFAHLALSEFIASGGDTWDRAVLIDDALDSVPRSATSDEPQGKSIPLTEVSRRAMLRGDNTALDHIVAMLGRDTIEASRNQIYQSPPIDDAALRDEALKEDPFLSAHEFHRIKCAVTDLPSRYASATPETRRTLLETEVPRTEADPTFLIAWRAPQLIDRVGYRASAANLARLGARLLSLSRKEGGSPALACLRPERESRRSTSRWTSISNRIGGEPGATAGLWIFEQSIERRDFALAIILNDKDRALDDEFSARIIAAALEAMAYPQ